MRQENGEYVEITNVDLELNEILIELEQCGKMKSNWYDFSGLLAPSLLLRTSIGIIIKFLQQLTGINSIFYYSSIIFQGKLVIFIYVFLLLCILSYKLTNHARAIVRTIFIGQLEINLLRLVFLLHNFSRRILRSRYSTRYNNSNDRSCQCCCHIYIGVS